MRLSQEYLPQAVDRVNQHREWLNEVVPKLRDIIKTAKVLKTGRLSKNDRTMTDIVLNLDDMPTFVRAFISVSEWNHDTIRLQTDCIAKTGDYGCTYLDNSLYLTADVEFVALKPTTVQEIYDLETEKQAIKAKISALEDSLYSVNRKQAPFNDK